VVTSLTIDQAVEAVLARVVDNWSGANYTFENEAFDPPPSGRWARFSVREADRTQATLGAPGARRFMSDGIIFAQLFDDKDAGTNGLNADAEEFRTLFEGVDFGGIRTHQVRVRNTGATERWHQFTCEVFFDYEQVK